MKALIRWVIYSAISYVSNAENVLRIIMSCFWILIGNARSVLCLISMLFNVLKTLSHDRYKESGLSLNLDMIL